MHAACTASRPSPFSRDHWCVPSPVRQRAVSFVEVAFPQPPHFGQAFSYAVPAGMELVAGDAVQAPFGPASLAGIVIATSERPVFHGDLRTVEQRLGAEP